MGFKNKDFQNFFFIRPTSKVRLFLIHERLKFFISMLQEKVFFNEISSVRENYVLSLSQKKSCQVENINLSFWYENEDSFIYRISQKVESSDPPPCYLQTSNIILLP